MLRHPCGIPKVQIIRLFDKRIDDEYLIPLLNFTADDLVDAVSLGFEKNFRSDRFLTRRHLIDNGDVKIAIYRHRQCSRNRGCSHDEEIRYYPFFPQRSSLHHAETMLFIDYDQSQILKGDPLLDQCMGSDYYIDLSAQQCVKEVLSLRLYLDFRLRVRSSGRFFLTNPFRFR